MSIRLGGVEDAATTWARDQWQLLECIESGRAIARLWRAPVEGLSLGRFHRAAPAAPLETPATVRRRLSGGRIVPIGPAIRCLTMAAPVANWFDPGGGALRPDQVLNRALRPLLSLLRGFGVDVLYPGRDLVTVSGRALAHASFTVLRDGATLVEAHVAESASFACLPRLLDAVDPTGVAGVDREAFAASTSLAEAGLAPRAPAPRGLPGSAPWTAPGSAPSTALDNAPRNLPGDEEWAAHLVRACAGEFHAEASLDDVSTGSAVAAAAEDAAADFLRSVGPMGEDMRVAASPAMLGVVECAARFRGETIRDLSITGDLIAPFHTLDDIATECEGEPLRPAQVRKALARALGAPRSFLLGIVDLDDLILRLAPG